MIATRHYAEFAEEDLWLKLAYIYRADFLLTECFLTSVFSDLLTF